MTPNKTSDPPQRPNQGIQATNVRANVLAVGPKAVAITTHGPQGSRHADFATLISELVSALDHCDIPPKLRATVDLDLTHLRQLNDAAPIDPQETSRCLAKLRSKLARITNVAEQVVLSELLKKMASVIGLALS